MDLLLKIWAVEGGYQCDIHRILQISPVITEAVFSSVRGMSRENLLDTLVALGFHEKDILDALAMARGDTIDPNSEQGKLLRHTQEILGHPKYF